MQKKIEDRLEKIIQKLLMSSEVQVDQLASEFNVTAETIRMDLSRLEKKGVLFRTHGGAILRDALSDVPLDFRLMEKVETKRKICTELLNFINNDDCLFVDPSSTAIPLGKLLRLKKNLVIVTNCLDFVHAAHESMNEIIVLGGSYTHAGKRTEGHFAIDMIEKLRFDVAIFGMDGCLMMDGPGTETEDALFINNHVMKRSKIKILISDSSKLERTTKFQYAYFHEFDIFITDDLPEDIMKSIPIPTIILTNTHN